MCLCVMCLKEYSIFKSRNNGICLRNPMSVRLWQTLSEALLVQSIGILFIHLFIFSLTLSECMELVQYTITSVYTCKRVGTIQFYSVVQLIFVHHHSLAAVRCVRQHHTVFWTLPRLPSSSRPMNLYCGNLALHSVRLQRPGGWQYSCFFFTQSIISFPNQMSHFFKHSIA